MKTASEIFAEMEKPISEFPKTTKVRMRMTNENEPDQIVEIPTKEIFVPGNWVARRYSGVKFSRIEKWMQENKPSSWYSCKSYSVIAEG